MVSGKIRHFKIQNSICLFSQVLGERTKNHQVGSEVLANSGIITDYTDPATGLNAFRLFEIYLEHLNPDLPRLFQKERIASKKFDIHDFETIVFFERAPKGENKISNMMPDLTTILEKPRLTNHSIRTQTIQTLIRLGFSEHEVTQFTGILI